MSDLERHRVKNTDRLRLQDIHLTLMKPTPRAQCPSARAPLLRDTTVLPPFEAVLMITSLIATGALSDEFYALLALGRVTPLKKGLKNKLRPLVCGSTWRRLTMSALCRQHKDVFRWALGHEQYAVGVESALEKLSAT